jgi:hypothetical protein
MRGLSDGIAHLSFRGGGFFLPARSPYDRQLLVEYVSARVRADGEVQVLLGNQRWMVHAHRGTLAAPCSICGQAVDSACYSSSAGDAPHCVKCAFGYRTRRARLYGEPLRRAV